MTGVAYAMGNMGGGQAGGGQGASNYMSLVFIAAVFAIFYFILIRPQQKRAKQHKAFLENLKKGDKIITSGGLYGTITGISDDSVTIEIAEKVRVKVDKGTVAAHQKS